MNRRKKCVLQLSVCSRMFVTASQVLCYLNVVLCVYVGRMIKTSQFYRATLSLRF
jgi:hypothetical protein